MTSSGLCDVCKKPAFRFIYNNPRLDPDSINDGNWLCVEHVSIVNDVKTSGSMLRPEEAAKAKAIQDTHEPKLNRAQRRRQR